MPLTFATSTLQLVMTSVEFQRFCEVCTAIATTDPEITGVLLTGSLVQRLLLPAPPTAIPFSPQAKAYATIVARAKRKLWPHLDSDLDIWICVADPTKAAEIRRYLDIVAIDLVGLYARDAPSNEEWISIKRRKLDPYYKVASVYPPAWTAKHGSEPWTAAAFKHELCSILPAELPDFARRIGYYFRKNRLEQFLEIRAFPACTFNLRPEKIAIRNVEDRSPFPYYLLDWIDPNRNCLVIYSSPQADIFPFAPNGPIPGQHVADLIGWTPRHVDSALFFEN